MRTSNCYAQQEKHRSFEMGKECLEKMRQKRARGGVRRSSDVQRGGRLINDGGDSGRGAKQRAISSRVRRKENDKKRRRKGKKR